MTINVRIAPSPTGLLHIGNVRAALFNWLFAKKQGGQFMLRLDDTDRERSTEAFAKAIERDLSWLGLTWDQFARQSDRLGRYTEILEQLKKSGRAYPCFETQAELDLKRKTQLGRGLPPVYDRAALKLSDAERENLIAQGRKPHWRFKLAPTSIQWINNVKGTSGSMVVWDDVVQGHKSFPVESLSDPVLQREDGVPLYTFCSVVDDIDNGVTHVIRGEDHVTNTAVQIEIWRAITSAPLPVFAHFPLIVAASGIEMSKRLGTLSIASMRDEMEIEPMAITSLLAKLGTSDPIAPRQSLQELIADFDLHKISRATPKFDLEELKTLNAKILHHMSYEDARPRLVAAGLGDVTAEFWHDMRSNLQKFSDIQLWWRVTHGPITPVCEEPDFVNEAKNALPPTPWDQTTWGKWTDAVKTKTGRKGKELFMPLRLALTGIAHGPEMKTLLPMIGPKRAADLLSGKVA